jgi:DUF4097 and DUF4098 domain-containing protein YvlB
MKEEIRRIMKLVEEGKLSADDAAELIDAFESAPPEDDSDEPEPSSESKAEDAGKKDPFAAVVEAIEKIGKEVSTSVNWSEIAAQIKEGTKKGVEAIKHAAEQAKSGRGWTIFGIAEKKEVELPLEVPAGKILRIENGSGDVKVFGGASTGTLIARAIIRGKDAEDAKSRAEAYTPVIEESDHFVLIRQPDVGGLHVDIEVRLASKASVEVRCEAGDIHIDGTGGGCRIDGRSGDVRLTGLDGAIEIDTVSGDVHISDSKTTSLDLEGKSGDIRIERVKGNFNVRTSAGDVSLREVSGRTISVEAVSGDVRLDVDEPVDGTINIRTVNGNSRVGIPDGSNCRVALSTLRGGVHTELFLKDEARHENRITGVLGDGAGTVDISAVNGDVMLALHDTATL